jgi:hypothetical protein
MIFQVGVGVAIFLILKNVLIICALYYLFYLISNFITEKAEKIEDEIN